MTKIIIELEGGLVRSVISDEPTDFVVIDFDNEGFDNELDQENGFHMSAPLAAELVKNQDFKEYYFDDLNPKDFAVVEQLREYGFIPAPTVADEITAYAAEQTEEFINNLFKTVMHKFGVTHGDTQEQDVIENISVCLAQAVARHTISNLD